MAPFRFSVTAAEFRWGSGVKDIPFTSLGSGALSSAAGVVPQAVGVPDGAEVVLGNSPKKVEDVSLADAAKEEVYVCFKGPFGVYLKQEVRRKICRDGSDESKEEKEKQRYWLIPRTFSSSLHVYSIMASVIGEKASENCSALFCYLDSPLDVSDGLSQGRQQSALSQANG